MYNSFTTNEWNISLFSSSGWYACLLNVNSLLDAGAVTFSSIFYLNASIASKNCSFMFILTFWHSVISIFTPQNLCFFPLVTTNPPKWLFKLLIKSSTTLAYMCDTLLSSTYHIRVYFLQCTSLFATHIWTQFKTFFY